MPKLKLGAAFYAFFAVGGLVTMVQIVVRAGDWKDVHGWFVGAMLMLVGLTTVLLAIGAVTRWGLISDQGPWICRNGWIPLIGLTVAVFVVYLVSPQGDGLFPLGPVVFLPHFVRRMQEQYSEGRQEASAAKRPAASGRGE